MHIYDFITDELQNQLKAEAQNNSSERFENVLNLYKDVFLNYFNSESSEIAISSKPENAKMLPNHLRENVPIQKWFSKFLSIAKSEVKVFRGIFEEVIDCYYLFIRGRHHTAVLKMYDVLERYEILNEADPANFSVFFRCIQPSFGDPSKLETYFHIPFNLRNKVKNQRFSVSGMPLWYGGASLLGTYYEMRQSELVETKDLAISAWAFSLWPDNRVIDGKYVRKRNKIYDITNEIYELINYGFASFQQIYDNERQSLFFDSHTEFYDRQLRTALRKFIISNLCTFQSKAECDPFHEEYVIPQLLTEAIKLHKFDGIIFPSTRFQNNKTDFNGTVHINSFKSNLAMFTEYSPTKLYDEELIANFNISILSKFDIDTVDNEKVLDHIGEMDLKLTEYFNHKICNLESDMKKSYRLRMERIILHLMTYNSIEINNVPYLDTFVGKLELTAIYNYVQYLYKGITVFFHELNFNDFLNTTNQVDPK